MMQSRQRIAASRRGMAMLDVIVAGVILSIGLAVVLSVASRSLANQADGESRLIASWLADELLNMVVVEGPDIYPKINDTSGSFDEPFEDYSYELTLTSLGQRQPYEVTAVIRWPSGGGASEIYVRTLISQRLGEPFQIRAPVEPIDRIERYFEDELEQP